MENLKFHVQIESKLYRKYPMRLHAEADYQLINTLGVQSSSVHKFDITRQSYKKNQMASGIDIEQILLSKLTGLNTRGGDLMTLTFKYMPAVIASGEPTRIADRMHTCLHSDHALEAHDTREGVFGYGYSHDV